MLEFIEGPRNEKVLVKSEFSFADKMHPLQVGQAKWMECLLGVLALVEFERT